MDPTTDITAFYDGLAADYDSMTGFDRRIVHDRPFFRVLLDRFGIGTAIDAGAGTGFHALLLAQLGVAVTAVDVSGAMLEHLAGHAARLGLNVPTLRVPMEALSPGVVEPVDAVFCMGNTIAHLPAGGALQDALQAFRSVLRPGGILFLQVLNYDRILADRERIQSVREEGGVTYVRFYDFAGDHLVFNILRLKRENGGHRHALSSVPLYPVTQSGIDGALAAAGFGGRKYFGDISLSPFDSSRSRDCVVLATQADSPTTPEKE